MPVYLQPINHINFFRLTVEDFSFDFIISKFHFWDLAHLISELSITVDVNKIKMDLPGFLNDDVVSNEISRLLSVFVPYLKEHREEVNESLSETVKQILNQIIFYIINGILDGMLGRH